VIQGLHASSVVFADFNSVSRDLLANLISRLPGINAAGHPVRLHGTQYTLRVGSVRWEKRDLVANLDLKFNDVPFPSQLTGTVRLQEVPKQPRTTVTFEGRCARNFGSLASDETTEAVRRLANDSSRALLEVLVTALEASAKLSPDVAVVRGPDAKGAPGSVPKPRRKRATVPAVAVSRSPARRPA